MDFATIIGYTGGFLLVSVIGVWLAKGSVLTFIDAASVAITLGGSLLATLAASSMKKFVNFPKYFMIIFKVPVRKSNEIILTLVSFSEKARREGLLALEDDLTELEDEFLRKGLQLVVDGTDPELVKTILYADTDAMESRHARVIKMFENMGYLAPAFGMIGTLIGLILAIAAGIDDKSALIAGVATALITTYYGAIMANLFFLPAASKLTDLHEDEVQIRDIMINGILAIQSGDNPRIVKDRLVSFLEPADRKAISEEVEEKK
ncbi:MAG: motility protein A [bacterium]|nr:motility protein A [bacterium]